MIPRIATAGASFQGAFLYYCHDKEARTTARVTWTQTRNMMTECAQKAWKVMAYTAKSAERLKEAAGQRRTGRKLEKPVFAYSLSWHPEQTPDKEAMLDAARQSLAKLGLSEHETMITAHRDEPQPHVHIIVNRVHPLTGIAKKLHHPKRKLSEWALQYERDTGKVYCKQREENARKRKQGQHIKYVDPQISQAWKQSDSAQGFMDALETKGYTLARGRKRLVVVDPYGKAANPVKHLEGVRAKEFNARMASIDPQQLPTPETVMEQRRLTEQKRSARMQSYEVRAAEAVNIQQSQHIEERLRVGSHHHRIIENERDRLTAFYKLDEKREEIEQLKQKLKKPGPLQRLARKVFRWDRKINRQIETLQANQDNAQQRLEEALGGLERSRDLALKNLKSTQEQKRQELKARLEKWRPVEHRREQSRPIPELSYDRQNKGPSMGR